jgi:hypothetical protein
MNKLGAQSDSSRSLIAAAIRWYLLAIAPPTVLGVFFGVNRVLNHPEMAQDTRYLLTFLTRMAADGIMLYGAFIWGRALGQGDVRVGLGDGPVSNRLVIALIAVLLAAYSVLLNIALYGQRPDLVSQLSFVAESPWRKLDLIFRAGFFGPISEEFFFEVGCGAVFADVGAPCQQPR